MTRIESNGLAIALALTTAFALSACDRTEEDRGTLADTSAGVVETAPSTTARSVASLLID